MKANEVTELDRLKSEAAEIGNAIHRAAESGDGAGVLKLRSRAQDLHTLLDMQELKGIDARLPGLEAIANRADETPESRAALVAEYETAQQAVRAAQEKLQELQFRNEAKQTERRAAVAELRALQRLRSEIIARTAEPTQAARSLAAKA